MEWPLQAAIANLAGDLATGRTCPERSVIFTSPTAKNSNKARHCHAPNGGQKLIAQAFRYAQGSEGWRYALNSMR